MFSIMLRRIAAAVAFGVVFVSGVSGVLAGQGRIDATNGDTFFTVNFRYPPTAQQIADVKSTIDMMAYGMCDATEGQMRVKRVTLTQGQATEDLADYWLNASAFRAGVSFYFSGANLGTLGSHIDMDRFTSTAPDVYLHEFGHHAFGLGDEYDEQSRFGGPCGIGPGFDSGVDEQNNSIMQQSGSARCVGGSNDGGSCFKNAQCPSGSCQFVRMSELSVASNADPLQGDGNSCPAVPSPGTMCPDNAYCMRAWNSGTARYEQTQQSEIHNDQSDWETLDTNYPFVTPPAGLPVAAAPGTCFRPVEYVDSVVGSDQVMLILDKSGSMSWSSNPAEGDVCGNGVDDDGDGSIDEMGCADPRVTFVKAAANAYLDLQRDLGVDVGVMTFNASPTLDRMIGTLNAGNIAAYKAIVDGIAPGGNTGIGDALDASNAEFTRVAAVGRSRTAYLITDGDNTSGVDPVAAANRLRDIGVRVHVVPAGADVSADHLSGVASATGGDLFPAALNDLTAIYAELAGRHRGAAMALPRINFQLSQRGTARPQERPTLAAGPIPPRLREFPIFVEKNAKSLVAFVSGRNLKISDWAMTISLRGPGGELYGPGSPELTVTPYYMFINVPAPTPGDWKLTAEAAGPALQEGTALAFIDNPDPDLFLSARPNIVAGSGKVTLAASPGFVTRLAPEGLTLTGYIEGPQGWRAPAVFTANSTGAFSAEAGPFPYAGLYRATAFLDAGATAAPAPGESIYPGPATPPVAVTPFRRFASAGFVVAGGKPACDSGNPDDCDGDGVDNRSECDKYGLDIDKDGRPNSRDPDSDGDEIPDSAERNLDLNQNRVPDMCERNEPRVAPPPTRGDTCVPVRRSMVKPRLSGKNWSLDDENVRLFAFGGDRTGALFAKIMLDRYGVTERCFVGRPGRSFSYFLSDGAAPKGPLPGERCTAFDPAGLDILQTDAGYALVSGKETVRVFADKAEAAAALAAIRRYGFTNLCSIGKDGGVEYLRR